MTNACVHPFFVHFAHALGCHFYRADRGDFATQEMQDTHLALAYQNLQQMKEEDDPFVYGQAHHYLALGALHFQATQPAIAYYEEAVKIVERNGLHILKDPGHVMSDPSHLDASEVLERAVFLGTLLHMETVLDMFNAEKRGLCYAIENEFYYRLPVCLPDFPPVAPGWLTYPSRVQKIFPFLFQVSLQILRVRSVLLVKEASEMIDSSVKPGIPQSDFEVSNSHWSCGQQESKWENSRVTATH